MKQHNSYMSLVLLLLQDQYIDERLGVYFL